MSAERREKKYQMLKLVHSGRTLGEAKALIKAVSVGLTGEYAKQRDIIDLLALEGTLYKLTGTRAAKTDLWKLKVEPRKPLPAPVEEVLAKWATPFRGKVPLSWMRDGNLIRRGKPNKPKIGSSKGKIGKTTVRGAKKVLSDLKMLIKAIQDLQKYDKDYRKKHGLDKFVKSITTDTTINRR
jgi:hypothetical protein